MKVREFIYFTRRNPNGQQQGQAGTTEGQQQGRGQARVADGQGQAGATGGHHGQGGHQQQGLGQGQPQQVDPNMWNGVPTHSRFDVFNSEQFPPQP